jgi:NTE family protein
VGQPLKTETLRRDLGRVMQSGEFELVQVSLEQDGDESKLVIDAKEKPYGPGYLRFGIGLETNLDGDSDFRAMAHYRRSRINRLGAEWRTLVTVGEPIFVSTEFFQPLDPRGFWFVEPGLSLEKTKRETFFVAGAPLEVIETKTQQVWLDLGVQFRNWGEVRVGALRGRYDAEASTESDLPPLELQIGGWQVRATLDQFDNPFFPRRGNYSQLSAFFSREEFGADEEYDKLFVSTVQAWNTGRNTFVAGIQIGTDLGSDIPAFDEFELGGFLNLSGFTRGELRGDVMALETVGYYYQVGDLGRFGSVYLGGFLQAGNVWSAVEEVEPGDQLYSGTIFLGVDTPFSPLYLGYGQAEEGPEEFYVFIGRAF